MEAADAGEALTGVSGVGSVVDEDVRSVADGDEAADARPGRGAERLRAPELHGVALGQGEKGEALAESTAELGGEGVVHAVAGVEEGHAWLAGGRVVVVVEEGVAGRKVVVGVVGEAEHAVIAADDEPRAGR